MIKYMQRETASQRPYCHMEKASIGVRKMPDNQESVITVCYGKETFWQTRQEAVEYFLQVILESEGSEQVRYINVYGKLLNGERICSDE